MTDQMIWAVSVGHFYIHIYVNIIFNSAVESAAAFLVQLPLTGYELI